MVGDLNPGDGSVSFQEQSNLGRETIVMQTMVLVELRSSQLDGRNRPSSSCFDIDAPWNLEIVTPSSRMPFDTG